MAAGAVALHAGYGTAESSDDQSLSVLDTETGAVKDLPDAHTLVRAKSTPPPAMLLQKHAKKKDDDDD